ncbi:MAG: hypothetical protein GWP18_05260 [Proteobacteria bacterium]|nr:hypothetical protein [Pseudomonadota bacterium]
MSAPRHPAIPDELAGIDAFEDSLTVHPIQPYQAVKMYECPGCSSTIEPGVGHLVIVPQDAPDLRRHWHRGCWYKERRRLGFHRPR